MSTNFEDLDFDAEFEEVNEPADNVQTERKPYVQPEEEKALDGMFESFTVKCFKKGERPTASIHQSISYATYEANKQHKATGCYTKIYGNVELQWKGRDRGYGIPDEE